MCIKCLFFSLLSLLGVAGVQAQHIVFTPQWTPQSQFAGYYVAEEKGYYQAAGLDVTIEHPSASRPALKMLSEGTCNIITLQLLQAMEDIDRGTSLVNILQTSQHNSLVIVPRHDDIRTVEDLAGKKVGIWKAGFGEPAQMLDQAKELHIRWIPFIHNVNLFVSGAIDATLAMSYNEYFQILAAGIQPTRIFRLSEMGYDLPEDGLYVTQDFYRKYPKEVRAFAKASQKGWEWAAEHPEEALDIVMKRIKKAKVGTNRTQQMWMLKEIIKLQQDKKSGKATFILRPEQVKAASELLLKCGKIKKEVTYQQLMGNF
ncbi:MAG: ABC transporter substrate-binding protein [Bacteroides sp.]|nr:ABC transporter substrate-binding protein [Bacteroides sp.]